MILGEGLKEGEIFWRRKRKELSQILCEKDIYSESELAFEFTKNHNLKLSYRGSSLGENFIGEGVIRRYILHSLIDFLYKKRSPPKKIIELGSAGLLDVTFAFPKIEVVSVDFEERVFNNEIYCFPKKFLRHFPYKKLFLDSKGSVSKSKMENCKFFTEQCLPNYFRKIEDARNLDCEDNFYDISLVQGTPELLWDFRFEISRITKKKGFVISVVYEENFSFDKPSFYDTGKYNSWTHDFALNPELENLPLKKIEVPQKFKRYEKGLIKVKREENLCSGIVFEIFKKI